jgi:hypothetical protein
LKVLTTNVAIELTKMEDNRKKTQKRERRKIEETIGERKL